MSLPNISDASVCLASARKDEQLHTWNFTHGPWSSGLPLELYLEREAYLLTVPLARDGGLSPWILTDSSVSPENRPILSTCETIRKRALYRDPADGQVKDVVAHGVASVFTYTELRGHRYASKMMAELGNHLAKQQAAKEGDAQFSILFSDIGKTFYARDGWLPLGCAQLTFDTNEAKAATKTAGAAVAVAVAGITDITDAQLPALAERDETLLRNTIASPSPNGSHMTRVAVIPDMDTLNWHYRREDFIHNHVYGHKPTVRGALYTSPISSSVRVWALWTRTRSGGGGTEGNPVQSILHFLRLVVEDEAATSDEELVTALRGILTVANREASEWSCTRFDTWNPSDKIRRVVESQLTDFSPKYEVRDEYSIPSLRWFGKGNPEHVEWVANEKFEWC